MPHNKFNWLGPIESDDGEITEWIYRRDYTMSNYVGLIRKAKKEKRFKVYYTREGVFFSYTDLYSEQDSLEAAKASLVKLSKESPEKVKSFWAD